MSSGSGAMEGGGGGGGGAYGAAKAGGTFDLGRFLQQPQVLARIVSALFALIVFSCLVGEGYINTSTSSNLFCVFNHNEGACRYGIGIGVLAFLACIFFFMVDIYFPQISNSTDRKYLVLADLGVSGLWTFLWFIGFCFLTNQWSWTKPEEVYIAADSARAAITFSFFSIFSWGLLIAFAYKRYKMGVEDFAQSYVDPTSEVSAPYSSYPNISHESYQQPPFTQTAEDPEGYQPPVY